MKSHQISWNLDKLLKIMVNICEGIVKCETSSFALIINFKSSVADNRECNKSYFITFLIDY